MRFVDLMLAFPSIFLLLIVAAILDGITVANVIIFLAAVRLDVAGADHPGRVSLAQAAGVHRGRAHDRRAEPADHLAASAAERDRAASSLPLTLDIALYILAEATLSFLGFGVKPEKPTWGNMLNEARTYSLTRPLLVIAPGLTITLVVLAINFIGDGLRDAFDPTSGR